MNKMHLQKEHYDKVKSGEKIYELRLFDEKRKSLKIGEILQFYNAPDESDAFDTRIKSFVTSTSFEELLMNIDCNKCGADSKSELLEILKKYYSLDKQTMYGVVAIEVERI